MVVSWHLHRAYTVSPNCAVGREKEVLPLFDSRFRYHAAWLVSCRRHQFWGGSSHLYNFSYYYPSFFLGLLFCKYALFEKFRAFMRRESACVAVCVVLTGLAFVIRKKWDITEMTILMTPLFIYLFVAFFRLIGKANKVFLFFGKHSMNMWLIHSFFCYYYFQKEMLMVSDNAVVDYVLLVAVSMLASMIIDGFRKIVGIVGQKSCMRN